MLTPDMVATIDQEQLERLSLDLRTERRTLLLGLYSRPQNSTAYRDRKAVIDRLAQEIEYIEVELRRREAGGWQLGMFGDTPS